MENKVSIFIAGCQKTGSTWLYNCFKEHPEIFVPKKDALHYFTINHDLGTNWYHEWYKEAPGNQLCCDGTPSYIRDPEAAQRIFDYNPKAKLIFVLRNPIDRAFSHYWHMKRKGLISYSFQDMLLYNEVGNIDLFQMWYYSSQYSNLLKPFLDTFPNQQVHVALFDDLKLNPRYFLESVFKFIGVDETFEPSILQKRVNSGDRGVVTRKSNAGIFSALFKKQTDTQKLDEYQLGVPPQVEARLLKKFHNEIEKLELLIDQDLTHWKTSKNGN